MQLKASLRSFISQPVGIVVCKLCAAWLFGMAVGAYVGFEIRSYYSPFLRIVSSSRLAVLGAVAILYTPVLLSLCVERLFSRNAVLLLAFLKAFLLTLVLFTCVYSWGSAGWLISGMTMISDLLAAPILLWLWYQILIQRLGKREVLACFLLLFAVGLFDYLVVSPFLCSLF